MSVIVCAGCGIAFGVPDLWEQNRRQDHKEFWCPNGHGNLFRERTKADEYKDLYEDAQAKVSDLWQQRLAAERAKEKAQMELKSLEKRTAAGVCPCCNRTVSQLASHMESKHQDFLGLHGLAARKALAEARETVLERPIEYLEISVRSYNSLKWANYHTIGDVVAKTENGLMREKNFGKKSLVNVKEALGKLGLALSG